MKSKPDKVTRVMLVDDQPERAALVEARLTEAGFSVLSNIPSAAGLLYQIEQQQPDVILIDLESPDRDVLESLAVVNDHNPTAVVMFTREDDPSYIEQAVAAGISTYLLGDIDPEQVKPLIDVAMAQFKSYQTLRSRLDLAVSRYEQRKLVEQAKGLLMAHRGLGEDEAHRVLTKLAMDANQRLEDVARTVLATLSSGRKSSGDKLSGPHN